MATDRSTSSRENSIELDLAWALHTYDRVRVRIRTNIQSILAAGMDNQARTSLLYQLQVHDLSSSIAIALSVHAAAVCAVYIFFEDGRAAEND